MLENLNLYTLWNPVPSGIDEAREHMQWNCGSVMIQLHLSLLTCQILCALKFCSAHIWKKWVHMPLSINSAGIWNIDRAKKNMKKTASSWVDVRPVLFHYVPSKILVAGEINHSVPLYLKGMLKKSSLIYLFASHKHIFHNFFFFIIPRIEDFLTLPNKKKPVNNNIAPLVAGSMLFILHQQVISVYSSDSWDPVNVVTWALCSL